MKFRVVNIEPYLRTIKSRMPFRFGKTVMTGMPVLYLRVTMEAAAGEIFEGWSACGIVSMWFDKDYSKSEARREADLYYSVAMTTDAYRAAGWGNAWELHKAVEPGVRSRLEEQGLNGLVAGYGIALVDSAIIDGVCRKNGATFFDGLKGNLLGFDEAFAGYLPEVPTATMAIRHTVGLGDPLWKRDIAETIEDGLPESLEDVIDHYGVRYFKIKVNNNLEESLDRLAGIAAVLESKQVDFQATLDGNEAFPDMESFLEFVEMCAGTSSIAGLWRRVLWIEQPVARHKALDPQCAPFLEKVSCHKPVIIDESDDTDAVFEQAITLGYRGISAKNCKGVYRTLGSYRTIRKYPDAGGLVLSSEDLTNQPIIPNQQDLCVAATLGITHSERNGHHFFQGFQFLSESERQSALIDYSDMYESGRDDVPTLKIRNGLVNLGQVNASVGLGITSAPDWGFMKPIDLPSSCPTIA